MESLKPVLKVILVGIALVVTPACTEHKRLASETVLLRQELDDLESQTKTLSDEYRVYADNLSGLKSDPALKPSKVPQEERARRAQSEVDILTNQKTQLEKEVADLRADFESYKKSN